MADLDTYGNEPRNTYDGTTYHPDRRLRSYEDLEGLRDTQYRWSKAEFNLSLTAGKISPSRHRTQLTHPLQTTAITRVSVLALQSATATVTFAFVMSRPMDAATGMFRRSVFLDSM